MAHSSLSRAVKKIQSAVSSRSSVKRDAFHRLCSDLSGEVSGYLDCKLPSGVEVVLKRLYSPSGVELYFDVRYIKDYSEELGDLVSHAVEKQTDNVCAVYTDYDSGGSYLECSKKVPASGDVVRKIKQAEELVLNSAEKAKKVIEGIKNMIEKYYG